MKLKSENIIFEGNVPAKMRDGITLYADIWRPEANGRFPILLQRTPYDKRNLTVSSEALGMNPIKLVNDGYVVIIQDVRGRYSSEGDFEPFINEAEDGYDTVEWAANLPYSNGNVGMYGYSYTGINQWMAASENPPHLKAIFPQFSTTDFYSMNYTNGALIYGPLLYWVLMFIAPDTLKRRGPVDGTLGDDLLYILDRLYEVFDDIAKGEKIELLKTLAPYYYEWLSHPSRDHYWDKFKGFSNWEKINIPAYHLGGWFDLFLEGTLKNYIGMSECVEMPGAKNNQKLMVGPWTHNIRNEMSGDLYVGLSASYLGINVTNIQIRWFDYWLKGVDNGILDEPPVKFFTMGENKWREEKEWPLSRAVATKYYFHSNGGANSHKGDGFLTQTAPIKGECPDKYNYELKNPVPTLGGSHILPASGVEYNAGPRNQHKVENRSDVLVYTTPPLEEDIEVTGIIEVVLYASVDSTDTFWVAKLTDVYPDGNSYNLSEGILRASISINENHLTNSLDPGEIYKYRISLSAISNLFKKGHKIRVQISSSDYPHYYCGFDNQSFYPLQKEESLHTVFHDHRFPSYIVLPIIPRS